MNFLFILNVILNALTIWPKGYSLGQVARAHDEYCDRTVNCHKMKDCPRPTWTRRSRRVRSPAASGWGCTGRRTAGPRCCVVKLQTSHLRLLSTQPVGAEPDNLCSQPLNGPAGSGRGLAARRGSCHVPGSERAVGRGTAGGRFSDSNGWKCPKSWDPCKKQKQIKNYLNYLTNW